MYMIGLLSTYLPIYLSTYLLIYLSTVEIWLSVNVYDWSIIYLSRSLNRFIPPGLKTHFDFFNLNMKNGRKNIQRRGSEGIIIKGAREEGIFNECIDILPEMDFCVFRETDILFL